MGSDPINLVCFNLISSSKTSIQSTTYTSAFQFNITVETTQMFLKKTTNRARLLAKVSAIFIALASSVAHAGYVENATVVKVRTTELNVAFIFVNTPILNRPACSASGTEQIFVFDVGSPGGKATLQNALLAKATGAKVLVTGRGQYPANYPGDQPCSLWGAIETVNFLDVLQ
jgi:hypothetical protein